MIYDYALLQIIKENPLQIIKENQYVIILQLTKCRDVIFHECTGRKCIKKSSQYFSKFDYRLVHQVYQ